MLRRIKAYRKAKREERLRERYGRGFVWVIWAYTGDNTLSLEDIEILCLEMPRDTAAKRAFNDGQIAAIRWIEKYGIPIHASWFNPMYYAPTSSS